MNNTDSGNHIKLSRQCFNKFIHYQKICKHSSVKDINDLKELEKLIANLNVDLLPDIRSEMVKMKTRLQKCRKERLIFTELCIPPDKQKESYRKAIRYITEQLRIINNILNHIAKRFDFILKIKQENESDDIDQDDNAANRESEYENNDETNTYGDLYQSNVAKPKEVNDDEDAFLEAERLKNHMAKLALIEKEEKEKMLASLRQEELIDNFRERFYQYINLNHPAIPLRDYKGVSTRYLSYLYTFKEFKHKKISFEKKKELLAIAQKNGFINDTTLPFLVKTVYDKDAMYHLEQDLNTIYGSTCDFKLVDEASQSLYGTNDENASLRIEFTRIVLVIALIFSNTEDSYYDWLDVYVNENPLPNTFPHYHLDFDCIITMNTYFDVAAIQVNPNHRIEDVDGWSKMNSPNNDIEVLRVLKMFVKRKFNFGEAFDPHKMLDRIEHYTDIKLSKTQRHNYELLRCDPHLCLDIATYITLLRELIEIGENSRGLELSLLYNDS